MEATGIESRTPRSRGKGEWPAARLIKWIEEKCRVPEGAHVGKPLKLAPFMKQDFRLIFDNPAGTRRAIISRGRKNAKTVEAALIVLLHLCGPKAKPNSQIYSAAQSRDQAAILFNLAAKMVRMSPLLHDFVQIRDTAKQLLCPALGTTYRALSADATTAYGLSPALIIFDELGQVRGPRSELYEALETATAAQASPLTVIISTQAPTDGDLLSILIDDAKAGHDARTVLRVDTADTGLDTFSVEAIRAANPAFDYFMNGSEVLAMAADAKRMPARQAEFENLILNRRVEVNSPFISRPVWMQCAGELQSLSGVAVYGGLDLSANRDLTAFVLIGRVNDAWQVYPTFWLPEDGLREKAASERVPYDLWRDQGYLDVTPGKSVDYAYVAKRIREAFDRHGIRKIAFDKWNVRFLMPYLIDQGLSESQIESQFAEFKPAYESMSPALRALEDAILNQKLVHGDHPVMNMCVRNAIVQFNYNKERRLVKSKSAGRIDGIVALAMAMGVAPLRDDFDLSGMIG